LQREDVHGLQQAIGFKLLADKRQMDVQEIANRVGKSVYFIRQQLKLNSLIPKWQTMFSKDAISLSQALEICVLPAEAQKHLYESEVTKDDEKAEHPRLSINNYVFNSYRGSLNEAAFDVKDPSLDSKAGACSTCHFNSSFASLFPGELLHSRCNNIACFKNKELLHVTREIYTSINDPAVILVYESSSVSDNAAAILNKEGVVAHKVGYGEAYREVHQPQLPIWDKFQSQQLNEGVSKKQKKDKFKKAEKDYSKAIAVFDKNVVVGKYKRALVVDSNYPGRKGKYIYVERICKSQPYLQEEDILSR
jgi:ParB family transcriptional regulator, chromosome partitioning protein